MLTTKYSKDSWGCIINEQSEGSLDEKLQRRDTKLGEILLNPLNRILAAGRLGYSNIKNRGFSIN